MHLCNSSNDPNDKENFDDEGVEYAERKYGRDSFNTLKKCWFNNEEFNCSGSFGNHMLENGFCFTLNMASAENGFLSFQGTYQM